MHPLLLPAHQFVMALVIQSLATMAQPMDLIEDATSPILATEAVTAPLATILTALPSPS